MYSEKTRGTQHTTNIFPALKSQHNVHTYVCRDSHLGPNLVKDLATHSVSNTGNGGHWGNPQMAMISTTGLTVGQQVLFIFTAQAEQGGQQTNTHQCRSTHAQCS